MYHRQHNSEGNESKTFLDNLNKLEKFLKGDKKIEEGKQYNQTLESFKKVVDSTTFGRSVHDWHEKHIKEFSENYRKVDVSITEVKCFDWKLHAV